MLKIPYQKLRLSSKGNLNLNTNNSENNTRSRISRRVLQGIPVLSIFALVGILSYSVGLQYMFTNEWLDIGSNKAYAESMDSVSSNNSNNSNTDDGIMPLSDTSASLTVDDGKIKDTIFAANGEFAYATHKISVNATNIKAYTLTLSRTKALTGPSVINDAGSSGITPANMDNQWGYAWIGEDDNPTTATYRTLAATNNLADINIDSNHNLSGSKQLVFGAKFGNSAINGTYHAEATLSMVATPRVVTNYVVNVNCNSGTGCTSPLNTSSDAESYTYTIPSATPTRSGYKFLGYNTTNCTTNCTTNNINTNYSPGRTITLTTASPALTLYAIWEEDIIYTYTISFANNKSNNLTSLPSDITCTSETVSCTTTLPNFTPGNNLGGCGWFTGWELTQEGTDFLNNPTYKSGSSITVTSDTVLYGAVGYLNYCI